MAALQDEMIPSSILFAGDPHGNFRQIIEVVLEYRPKAVIMLGDLTPDRPLEDVVEPILDMTQIYWIPGNHEGDRDGWYDYTFNSALWANNIHGRVIEIEGIRVAGLGGVFRAQVWYPKQGSEEPHPERTSKNSFLQKMGKGSRWRGGLNRRHRVTIFHNEIERLMQQDADILVTHEAPTCHKNGFAAIDNLARAMGVGKIFHGHHHRYYVDGIEQGIRVIGVGLSECVDLSGQKLGSSGKCLL